LKAASAAQVPILEIDGIRLYGETVFRVAGRRVGVVCCCRYLR
jgi:hypothetical protein